MNLDLWIKQAAINFAATRKRNGDYEFSLKNLRKLIQAYRLRYVQPKIEQRIAEEKSKWLLEFASCVKVLEAKWCESPYTIKHTKRK